MTNTHANVITTNNTQTLFTLNIIASDFLYKLLRICTCCLIVYIHYIDMTFFSNYEKKSMVLHMNRGSHY